MIVRIWRGWTSRANAQAYETLLREDIIPGIAARGIAGYRGMSLLRRDDGGESEFATVLSELSAPREPNISDSGLARYGVLDASARRALRRHALESVVAPCAARLLRAGTLRSPVAASLELAAASA